MFGRQSLPGHRPGWQFLPCLCCAAGPWTSHKSAEKRGGISGPTLATVWQEHCQVLFFSMASLSTSMISSTGGAAALAPKPNVPAQNDDAPKFADMLSDTQAAPPAPSNNKSNTSSGAASQTSASAKPATPSAAQAGQNTSSSATQAVPVKVAGKKDDTKSDDDKKDDDKDSDTQSGDAAANSGVQTAAIQPAQPPAQPPVPQPSSDAAAQQAQQMMASQAGSANPPAGNDNGNDNDDSAVAGVSGAAAANTGAAEAQMAQPASRPPKIMPLRRPRMAMTIIPSAPATLPPKPKPPPAQPKPR
jgi:hypothetical protein